MVQSQKCFNFFLMVLPYFGDTITLRSAKNGLKRAKNNGGISNVHYVQRCRWSADRILTQNSQPNVQFASLVFKNQTNFTKKLKFVLFFLLAFYNGFNHNKCTTDLIGLDTATVQEFLVIIRNIRTIQLIFRFQGTRYPV